ncbi:MAG: T9SS type A sorting domain-containing protein [Alloprevotella sp.]|nr:T9SS type A sorting domain-containing protein [Alloprevotella sp.]
MRRILISLFCIIASTAYTYAQDSENWDFYLSYTEHTQNIFAGDKFYCVTSGNLMSYSLEDEEVHLYDSNNGMSGKNILLCAYSKVAKVLTIIYDDGNIDLLDESDNFTQLSQYRSASAGAFNAKRLQISGRYAVFTSGSEVVVIDLIDKTFKGVYNLEQDLYVATIFNNEIWAAGDNFILRCPLNKNPYDLDNWSEIINIWADNFVQIGDKLYVNIRTQHAPYYVGFWEFTITGDDGAFTARQIQYGPVYTASTGDKYGAIMFNASQICVVNEADISNYTVVTKPADISTWYSVSRDDDGFIWISEGFNGLKQYSLDTTERTLTPTGRIIPPMGIQRDLAYYMRYEGERLLVAGGRLDPYARQWWPGTIMYYENGEWGSFQEEGISQSTGLNYRNITSIVQDPRDPNHHFAASAGQGIYEFQDYNFVRLLNESNSGLLSIVANNPNYLRIDGLNYDQDGNLWVVNNQVESPLKCMKPDGTWKDFYVEPIDAAPTLEKTLIDPKGRIWVASRRTVGYHDAGLLCYDTNGTIDNEADDLYRYRIDGYNQDSRNVRLGGVYALALDKTDRLWVGTETGLYVVDNTDDYFNSNFNWTQVKVPRNDGTNLADYLLADVSVSALAVDGANRKWIGTMTSGLYLVSADGSEILEHYSTENSPILSDYILSIAINEVDGTVMIGTSVGLCSLKANVANFADDLQKDNIRVYPNPVRPEYSGPVTLTGMTKDAEVKVVTSSGKAVYVGRANSGNFTWDLTNQHGERVGSGVYFFYISTDDSKKGVVAKIIVI